MSKYLVLGPYGLQAVRETQAAVDEAIIEQLRAEAEKYTVQFPGWHQGFYFDGIQWDRAESVGGVNVWQLFIMQRGVSGASFDYGPRCVIVEVEA